MQPVDELARNLADRQVPPAPVTIRKTIKQGRCGGGERHFGVEGEHIVIESGHDHIGTNMEHIVNALPIAQAMSA